MKHQNQEATITAIWQKYWFIYLRGALKTLAAKCIICLINRSRPTNPFMAPLLDNRLMSFVRTFSYTEIANFGPINISNGRRVAKWWFALFTCLSVRAMHIEIAYDLSSETCIITIRNFINRRSVPVRIRNDNVKNYIDASEEAKRFDEVFECWRIQAELSWKGLECLFNCPSHPLSGLVWERMVRCVKRVLKSSLKEIAPKEHTPQCFIIEAENIVNNRWLQTTSL